ncbi:hypothetical protein GCM10029964_032830 [Kibdelosporangium lantanae]
MSHVPIGSQADGRDFLGPSVAARYPSGLVPQGISAELIAAKWGLSRARLDSFAAMSHQRAAAAWADGRFARDVAPLRELAVDESVRPSTTVDVLASLKPAFYAPGWESRFPEIGWHVTAGNSSPSTTGPRRC